MWRKINALIRFFYRKDPEQMSLDERMKLECELKFLSKTGVLNIELS